MDKKELQDFLKKRQEGENSSLNNDSEAKARQEGVKDFIYVKTEHIAGTQTAGILSPANETAGGLQTMTKSRSKQGISMESRMSLPAEPEKNEFLQSLKEKVSKESKNSLRQSEGGVSGVSEKSGSGKSQEDKDGEQKGKSLKSGKQEGEEENGGVVSDQQDGDQVLEGDSNRQVSQKVSTHVSHGEGVGSRKVSQKKSSGEKVSSEVVSKLTASVKASKSISKKGSSKKESVKKNSKPSSKASKKSGKTSSKKSKKSSHISSRASKKSSQKPPEPSQTSKKQSNLVSEKASSLQKSSKQTSRASGGTNKNSKVSQKSSKPSHKSSKISHRDSKPSSKRKQRSSRASRISSKVHSQAVSKISSKHSSKPSSNNSRASKKQPSSKHRSQRQPSKEGSYNEELGEVIEDEVDEADNPSQPREGQAESSVGTNKQPSMAEIEEEGGVGDYVEQRKSEEINDDQQAQTPEEATSITQRPKPHSESPIETKLSLKLAKQEEPKISQSEPLSIHNNDNEIILKERVLGLFIENPQGNEKSKKSSKKSQKSEEEERSEKSLQRQEKQSSSSQKAEDEKLELKVDSVQKKDNFKRSHTFGKEDHSPSRYHSLALDNYSPDADKDKISNFMASSTPRRLKTLQKIDPKIDQDYTQIVHEMERDAIDLTKKLSTVLVSDKGDSKRSSGDKNEQIKILQKKESKPTENFSIATITAENTRKNSLKIGFGDLASAGSPSQKKSGSAMQDPSPDEAGLIHPRQTLEAPKGRFLATDYAVTPSFNVNRRNPTRLYNFKLEEEKGRKKVGGSPQQAEGTQSGAFGSNRRGEHSGADVKDHGTRNIRIRFKKDEEGENRDLFVLEDINRPKNDNFHSFSQNRHSDRNPLPSFGNRSNNVKSLLSKYSHEDSSQPGAKNDPKTTKTGLGENRPESKYSGLYKKKYSIRDYGSYTKPEPEQSNQVNQPESDFFKKYHSLTERPTTDEKERGTADSSPFQTNPKPKKTKYSRINEILKRNHKGEENQDEAFLKKYGLIQERSFEGGMSENTKEDSFKLGSFDNEQFQTFDNLNIDLRKIANKRGRGHLEEEAGNGDAGRGKKVYPRTTSNILGGQFSRGLGNDKKWETSAGKLNSGRLERLHSADPLLNQTTKIGKFEGKSIFSKHQISVFWQLLGFAKKFVMNFECFEGTFGPTMLFIFNFFDLEDRDENFLNEPEIVESEVMLNENLISPEMLTKRPKLRIENYVYDKEKAYKSTIKSLISRTQPLLESFSKRESKASSGSSSANSRPVVPLLEGNPSFGKFDNNPPKNNRYKFFDSYGNAQAYSKPQEVSSEAYKSPSKFNNAPKSGNLVPKRFDSFKKIAEVHTETSRLEESSLTNKGENRDFQDQAHQEGSKEIKDAEFDKSEQSEGVLGFKLELTEIPELAEILGGSNREDESQSLVRDAPNILDDDFEWSPLDFCFSPQKGKVEVLRGDSPRKSACYLHKNVGASEFYFQKIKTVNIANGLMYIGAIDPISLKFHGSGKIVTEKGEIIYEGTNEFQMA